MFQNVFKKLNTWDRKLCLRISRFSGKKALDRFMYLASHFGYGYSYPVIGAALMVFDYANTQFLFHIGIVSFLIEHAIHKFIKKLSKRLRPFEALPEIRNLMKSPDKFSFPSGHAAGAFMMATILKHFYPALAIPMYFIASVIGVSRIYNGVHYPSDVVAGSALGFCSARIGLSIFI